MLDAAAFRQLPKIWRSVSTRTQKSSNGQATTNCARAYTATSREHFTMGDHAEDAVDQPSLHALMILNAHRSSSSMFCASRLTPVAPSCSRLISPAACSSAASDWANDGVVARSACMLLLQECQSVHLFIQLVDQYLLVGIGTSPSVMAFRLLGQLVTFPRRQRARSLTVLTFALLCAPLFAVVSRGLVTPFRPVGEAPSH